MSVLASGLRDTGACGLYGTGGWEAAWLPLFRRAGRVYVALDRDATDRAVALARTFVDTRGRVLVPPEELGPKGDLNDWLRVGAKGDPAAFRSLLERALAASPTPWALLIQRTWRRGISRTTQCARPPVRAWASGTAEPRWTSAIAGEAVRGGARCPSGGGP
jgi:hypothetical protein